MSDILLIWGRSLITFTVLLILARTMGKKQISQLTFFDYVVGITIGSVASMTSLDLTIPIFNGINTLLAWTSFVIILSIISLRSKKISKIVDGSPTVLVQKGKVLENNLRKAKLTADELMLNLRKKNAFQLSDVEFAILETDGELSVLKKSYARPLTPKVAGIDTPKVEHEPRILIYDGKIMTKTLQSSGFTETWLERQLQASGVKSAQEVFLAQLTLNGQLYVDTYESTPTNE